MKQFIKGLIPELVKKDIRKVRDRFIDAYYLKSYSQEGEDMILKRYFSGKTNGFYIDVGAHHPKLFSNTYTFYKNGWKGINIDPLPGIMEYFKTLRPRDTNLQVGISEKRQMLTYHMFNEPALNGFSNSLSKQYENETSYQLIQKVDIETFPLSEVLDRYLPKDQTIDFLSVDAEGLDFEVLKSNNWDKYKPQVVLIEDLEFSLNNKSQSLIYNYLTNLEYELFAKTINTVFFRKN